MKSQGLSFTRTSQKKGTTFSFGKGKGKGKGGRGGATDATIKDFISDFQKKTKPADAKSKGRDRQGRFTSVHFAGGVQEDGEWIDASDYSVHGMRAIEDRPRNHENSPYLMTMVVEATPPIIHEAHLHTKDHDMGVPEQSGEKRPSEVELDDSERLYIWRRTWIIPGLQEKFNLIFDVRRDTVD